MAAEGKGPTRFAIEVLEDATDAAAFRSAIGAGSGSGGTGDVVGPASAVDDRIATFDGTTGKLIQDSGTTLADITTALSGKSNAGHTHAASEVTDFAEAVDDRVGALLTAGSNVTLTYNDGAGTLTIAATGGGSGLTQPQVMARTLGC